MTGIHGADFHVPPERPHGPRENHGGNNARPPAGGDRPIAQGLGDLIRSLRGPVDRFDSNQAFRDAVQHFQLTREDIHRLTQDGRRFLQDLEHGSRDVIADGKDLMAQIDASESRKDFHEAIQVAKNALDPAKTRAAAEAATDAVDKAVRESLGKLKIPMLKIAGGAALGIIALAATISVIDALIKQSIAYPFNRAAIKNGIASASKSGAFAGMGATAPAKALPPPVLPQNQLQALA